MHIECYKRYSTNNKLDFNAIIQEHLNSIFLPQFQDLTKHLPSQQHSLLNKYPRTHY